MWYQPEGIPEVRYPHQATNAVRHGILVSVSPSIRHCILRHCHTSVSSQRSHGMAWQMYLVMDPSRTFNLLELLGSDADLMAVV